MRIAARLRLFVSSKKACGSSGGNQQRRSAASDKCHCHPNERGARLGELKLLMLLHFGRGEGIAEKRIELS